MPTTNAVPSADPSDLLFNAQKLDEVVNGSAESFFDRRGVERLTLTGALRLIGFEAPAAFTTGLTITRSTQTVTNGGNTYHADPASLPFTTTGTFNGAQWRLVSNVTQADLTTYAIPRTGASDLTASFKTTGTWEATGFKLDTNALWSLVSSNPTWQADAGDTMAYNRTSNRWSMTIGGTERFYVTAADGPARGTDAETSDGLTRKSQVDSMIASSVSNRMQYSLTASQTTTSGTAVDFTALPAWAKRVTLLLDGVSTAGANAVTIYLGTASGFETSGYQGSAGYITGVGSSYASVLLGAAGVNLQYTGAADARSGSLTFYKTAGDRWIFAGALGLANAGSNLTVAGAKTLAGTLDRVRLTATNGTDVFDAGAVTLLVEG